MRRGARCWPKARYGSDSGSDYCSDFFDPTRMKKSIGITPNIETLFGTRDENVRVLEDGLNDHHQPALERALSLRERRKM